MTQLFNTLFITEPDVSLHLEGEAIRAEHSDGRADHIPFCPLEKIVVFSHNIVTRPLIAYCATHHIDLCFLSEGGRFLFRITGPLHGNVDLRKRQYTLPEEIQTQLATRFIEGKIRSEIALIQGFRFNHSDKAGLKASEEKLRATANAISCACSVDQIRGLEGNAAHDYFKAFGQMILSKHPEYQFAGKNRRPPTDPCNAMLSFAYTLLAEDCAAALEAVGLDPYVGVIHGERPAKPAFALDLMELFRASIADRHVLRVINRGMISPASFVKGDDGGVYLDGDGKKAFLREWNRWKKEKSAVPGFDTTVPNGLMVHLEAQRLARWLRGEDTYRGIGVN